LQISGWDVTLEADASMLDWGAYCQGQRAGGPWTAQEQRHINYLELMTVFLALQSFCSTSERIAVLLCQDNVTAISFLNRRGRHLLSDLTTQIWDWYIRKDIFIHAEHLPGVQNV